MNKPPVVPRGHASIVLISGRCEDAELRSAAGTGGTCRHPSRAARRVGRTGGIPHHGAHRTAPRRPRPRIPRAGHVNDHDRESHRRDRAHRRHHRRHRARHHLHPDPNPRTTSESATTGDVLSSSVPLTTPGPTDGARAEAEDPLAAQPDEQRTGTDTTPTRQPAPRSARRRRRRPHIRPGLCRAPATVAATTPTPVPPPRLR